MHSCLEDACKSTTSHCCPSCTTNAPYPASRVCPARPQLVGFVLKVSCATPVLGPTMGLVGVGLANVLAGQASRHTRKMVVTKSHPLAAGFWEAPNPEDMVLDAVMGVCIFKVRAQGCSVSDVISSVSGLRSSAPSRTCRAASCKHLQVGDTARRQSELPLEAAA